MRTILLALALALAGCVRPDPPAPTPSPTPAPVDANLRDAVHERWRAAGERFEDRFNAAAEADDGAAYAAEIEALHAVGAVDEAAAHDPARLDQAADAAIAAIGAYVNAIG